MPLYGSVGFFQRAFDRVFGDLYSDPMFRMVDPNYLHFPLAIESAPQKLGARLVRIPVHEESSSESDDMDVQEVIEIEESDDSEDEPEYRTTSVMNLGRKRKLRRAMHRPSGAEKKRQRDESEDYMSDVEEDSVQSTSLHSVESQAENAAPTASGAEPETKKAKADDESRMDVSPTSNTDCVGLFGWKPDVNLTEHEDRFVISARLPGFGTNDVSLDLDEYDGKSHPYVKLTAQKTLEQEDGSELSSVKFVRLIPVPAAVSLDNISASWADGSLYVTVTKPKPEPKPPVRIEIANQQ